MNRRIGVVMAIAGVSVAVGATPAAAHPDHPPHDPAWCGAQNMRRAYTHMSDAMTDHTNENGDIGMFRAVGNAPC